MIIDSELDLTIVANALDLAERYRQSYDFKNSETMISLEKNEMKLLSDDQWHLDTVLEIIRSKFTKRDLSLKGLEYGKIEPAAGGCVRQVVSLKSGVPMDEAKKMVRELKAAGLKVNAQIQGEAVPITGKTRMPYCPSKNL